MAAETSAVSATQSSSSNTFPSAVKKTITKDQTSEFMLMLTAQLKNQNPMQPMDEKEMMGQVAQLNSLDELKSIRTLLSTAGNASEYTYAVSLIGKKIKAALSDGKSIEGVVTSASLTSDKTILHLGDTDVDIKSVVEVSGADK